MAGGRYSEARYRTLKEKAAVTIYERAWIGKVWVITFYDTGTFANPEDVPLSAFRTILVPLDTTLKAKNPVTRDFVEWHLGQTLTKEDLPFLRFYHEQEKVNKETILSQLVEENEDYCFLVARVEKPDPSELAIPKSFHKFMGRKEATANENQRSATKDMANMTPRTTNFGDFKGNKTFPGGLKSFGTPQENDLARDVRQPSATPVAFKAHLRDMHRQEKSNHLPSPTPTENRRPRGPRGPRGRSTKLNHPPSTSQARNQNPPGPSSQAQTGKREPSGSRQSLTSIPSSISTLEAHPPRATSLANDRQTAQNPGHLNRKRQRHLRKQQQNSLLHKDKTLENKASNAGTPMNGPQMDSTQVHRAQVDGARTSGTQMDETQMEGIHMEGIQMGGTQVDGTQMDGMQMEGIQMEGKQVFETQMNELGEADNYDALIVATRSVFASCEPEKPAYTTNQPMRSEKAQPALQSLSEATKAAQVEVSVSLSTDQSSRSQLVCPRLQPNAEIPSKSSRVVEEAPVVPKLEPPVTSQTVCLETTQADGKASSEFGIKAAKENSFANSHAVVPEELTQKLLSLSRKMQKDCKELAREQIEVSDPLISSPLSSVPATPRSNPIEPEDADNEENLFQSIDQLEAEINIITSKKDADEVQIASSFHDTVFNASIQSIAQMRLLAATRLKSLVNTLTKFKNTSSKDQIAIFRAQAEALISMPKQGRVVIGVIGDTGAGKSSLINALLEEEQLVPTSGMKACTAAVTEIKYKESDGYCAEIEFVTWEEWIAELEFVRGLCEDEEWNEAAVGDEELGAVWEKVIAVYPSIRSLSDFKSQYEEISNKAEPHLTHTLGQTLSISHHNGKEFNKLVTPYVEMGQHWPLIKSVHISVCSPLLASGAVLVDLPGNHDSNTGRAAVAARFLQECTHFLVVADIKRAVDNQTAKEILTEDLVGLKLTRDGLEGNVAFVCTQTDLFSRAEIVKGCPDFQPEMDRLTEDIDALKNDLAISKSQEKDLEREERQLKSKSRDLGKRKRRWEEVQRLVGQGLEAFPVTLSMGNKKRKKATKLHENDSLKRPRSSPAPKTNSLSRYFSDPDSDSELSSAPESETECESSPDEDGSPQRAETPKELTRILRDIRKELRSTETRIEKLGKALIKLPAHHKELHYQIEMAEKALDCACIATRNNFSRSTIKRQFAQGHREQDRANFLASIDSGPYPSVSGTQGCDKGQSKDYDAIAEAFPVFCISSRGYSQLQGRFKKENWTTPFNLKEQTEIPALKAYIESCTAIPLRNMTLEFIVKLEKLLNAIDVWRSSDEGRAGEGTLEEREEASAAVHDSMEIFNKIYQSEIDDLAAKMSSLLFENITAALPDAITSATASASSIFDSWRRTGSILNKASEENEPGTKSRRRKEGPKARGNGGMTWNSFRAHCRLDGNPPPRSKANAVNMNAELTSLLFMPLESAWANLFTIYLPPCIFAFLTSLRTNLLETARIVSRNLIPFGLNPNQLTLFNKKTILLSARLSIIYTDLARILANTQRGIFPLLTNVVKRQMSPGYAAAAKCPVGRGMYDTMISMLQSHLDTLTPTLYPSLTELIKQMLEDLVSEARNRWKNAGKEVWDSIFLHLKNYGVLPVENLRRTRAMERGVARVPSRAKVEVAKVVQGLGVEVRRILEVKEVA